ncbi:ArsR/SmtB family transcription factor [Paenibacillus popilliae]|uniref:Predicted transcriptional regulator n=1 Tax=Paenibacillus popilliae ATCC 14706 TaxID=1212764 RepID=M9M4K2_PAEPP|nr:metalloregulator ArsR/SmtB family transcription factor [Paenibacillus popilliae]GAC44024.1 predicted transcriptional regulator [Paenibacillus popilliae ATCC 14706]
MMISIEEMAEQFKLLGDKTRLKIVSLLSQQQMCVCHLVELLQSTQPNISQHLRKLKDAGLVVEERRGQWIYYSLSIEDKPHLKDAIEYLPKVREEEQVKINAMMCD